MQIFHKDSHIWAIKIDGVMCIHVVFTISLPGVQFEQKVDTYSQALVTSVDSSNP